MNMEEISRVTHPQELEIGRMKHTEVRFDCLVKIFDETNVKGKPPQMFKNETRLTLEMVKYGTLEEIGYAIKKAYYALESHIKLHEENQKI